MRIVYPEYIDRKTHTYRVEDGMSNIEIHTKREEPQTIVVHRMGRRQNERTLDARMLNERRRLIRMVIMLWLIASAQPGARLLA
jgi:hypothetical protein